MAQMIKKLSCLLRNPKVLTRALHWSLFQDGRLHIKILFYTVSLAHWWVLKQTNDLIPSNCSAVLSCLVYLLRAPSISSIWLSLYCMVEGTIYEGPCYAIFSSRYFLILSSKYSQKIPVLRLSRCSDSRYEDNIFRTDWQKTSLEFNLVLISWNAIFNCYFRSQAYELHHIFQSLESWDSSIGLATGRGLDGRGTGFRFLEGARYSFP